MGWKIKMCKKKNYKTSNTQIDKCMRLLITNLNLCFKSGVKTIASCCGHGKYPMTIIVKSPNGIYELISGELIQRIHKLYHRDKQGYYYIPETVEE